MKAFLEVEEANCRNSGEPTTLATARGSLDQMPEEVLQDIVGRHHTHHDVDVALDELIKTYGENADFSDWLQG